MTFVAGPVASLGASADLSDVPIVVSPKMQREELANDPAKPRGRPAASKIDRTLDNCLEVIDHPLRKRWVRRVR
jgi:hypothetical protein